MKKTNIDSPFYRTMGKIGDLLFANLLWLVCCLPIVTAGASTLGLFTVVNKMAAKEDYTVHTDFFKAFKRDFKQSTALWLVLLLAGFAALTGLRTATAQDTPSTGILAAASFLLFITAVVMAYLLDDSFGFLVGGVGLFATLLSVYGFIMGLLSFSEEGRSHKTSIIGSISNGLFLIVWIGVYLTGL